MFSNVASRSVTRLMTLSEGDRERYCRLSMLIGKYDGIGRGNEKRHW